MTFYLKSNFNLSFFGLSGESLADCYYYTRFFFVPENENDLPVVFGGFIYYNGCDGNCRSFKRNRYTKEEYRLMVEYGIKLLNKLSTIPKERLLKIIDFEIDRIKYPNRYYIKPKIGLEKKDLEIFRSFIKQTSIYHPDSIKCDTNETKDVLYSIREEVLEQELDIFFKMLRPTVENDMFYYDDNVVVLECSSAGDEITLSNDVPISETRYHVNPSEYGNLINMFTLFNSIFEPGITYEDDISKCLVPLYSNSKDGKRIINISRSAYITEKSYYAEEDRSLSHVDFSLRKNFERRSFSLRGIQISNVAVIKIPKDFDDDDQIYAYT